jgi:hypothetical protein
MAWRRVINRLLKKTDEDAYYASKSSWTGIPGYPALAEIVEIDFFCAQILNC